MNVIIPLESVFMILQTVPAQTFIGSFAAGDLSGQDAFT